jgi:hypothetical protein
MQVAKFGTATDAHQLLVAMAGPWVMNERYVVVDRLSESGRSGIGLVLVGGVEQLSAAPYADVTAWFEVIPEKIVEVGIVRPFDRYPILIGCEKA